MASQEDTRPHPSELEERDLCGESSTTGAVVAVGGTAGSSPCNSKPQDPWRRSHGARCLCGDCTVVLWGGGSLWLASPPRVPSSCHAPFCSHSSWNHPWRAVPQLLPGSHQGQEEASVGPSEGWGAEHFTSEHAALLKVARLEHKDYLEKMWHSRQEERESRQATDDMLAVTLDVIRRITKH